MRYPLWIVWALLGLLVVTFVINTGEPAGTWEELMEFAEVKNTEAYTRLGMLGVVLVGICAVLRIWRQDEDR
jgi:hypothetical protein